MKYLPVALSVISCLLFAAVGKTEPAEKPITFEEYKNAVKVVDADSHRMTWKEFRNAAGKKNVYVLDLRSEHEYRQGHLKGALHLGADAAEEKLQKLVPDKDATIVVYCTNTFIPTRMISLTFATLPQIVAQKYSRVYMLDEVWRENSDMNAFEKLKQGPLWEASASTK